MAESERMVRSVRKDEVEVNNLIINQVIPDGSSWVYVDRILGNQDKCITETEAAGQDKKICLVQVRFFDVEVRRLYRLRAKDSSMFPHSGNVEFKEML